MNVLQLLAKNKGHAYAYVILIIAGATGYTNLLLELGALRAETHYQEQAIQALTDSCVTGD